MPTGNKFAEIMETVNKRYKGKYTALASDTTAFKMERIPTGILAVDGITYGGIPKRRIVIFWGAWSSAKTFTALKTCARAQRTCRSCNSFMEHRGTVRTIIDSETGEVLLESSSADEFLSKVQALEDMESRKNTSPEGKLDEASEKHLKTMRSWFTKSGLKGKQFRTDEERSLLCPKCGCSEGLTPVWTAIEEFDQSFATMAGVDLSKLYVIRSEYAEQAIDISAEFMRTGKCDLMVIDSIAMMAPSKEIEESVTGDAVVSIRAGNDVQVMQIADLCAKWERGECLSGAEVRGYSEETASFGWYPLGNVWRLPAGKRIFKVHTKYGREISVTEDHSVFRVTPVNRRCVNRAKHTYRYSAAVECVKGKELRVGDLMLLEDSFECGRMSTIRLSDELREAAYPVYAAAIADESYARCKRGRDPKGNWSRGTFGKFVPLPAAQEKSIEFSGSELLYGRGSSNAVSNDLPSDILGWLIGFVAGDGYVFRQPNGSSGIRLYVGDGPSTRRIFRKIHALKKFGDIGIKQYRRESSMIDVELHCAPLTQVFERWFSAQEARTKRLPSIVFNLNEAGRRAVIEGLIDSDGHRRLTGNRYRVTFTTTSKLLAWDVIELLKSVNVTAAIRTKPAKSGGTIKGRTIEGGESWVVDFSGWSLYSSASSRRGSGRSQIDTASGIPVRIQSIEEVPTEEVFDLSVCGAETFVANGLLVHNSAEKWQQGLMARLMNKALRRWAAGQTVLDVEGGENVAVPTLILINQVREKIGVMYGSPDVLPGGKGQGFANSLLLKFRGGQFGKSEDKTITYNQQIFVTVEKSKVCVDEGSMIFAPSRGKFVRIADVRVGESVLSFQPTPSQRIAPSETSHVTPVGKKRGFLIKLQGGRDITCSAEHEFLTWGRMWTPAEKLQPGAFVGVPREVALSCATRISVERAALIGYLLGDGNVGGKTSVSLINSDTEIVDDFTRCIKTEFGYSVACRTNSGNGLEWAVTRKHGPGNAVREWLREIGMLGCRAWEKKVPACMFSAGKREVGVMIACYLATDGWVTLEKTYPSVGFSSTSRELLDGVKLLLLSNGIMSTVTPRHRDSRRDSWELKVSSFSDVVKLGKLLRYRKTRKPRVLIDAVRGVDLGGVCPPRSSQSEQLPPDALTDIKAALLAGRVSVRAITHDRNRRGSPGLASLLGQVDDGPLKRWNVNQALSLCDDGAPNGLIPESIAWVRVISIEDVGDRMMYDLSVPGAENYVVNDIITHNCPPHERGDYVLWLRDHKGNPPGTTSEPKVVLEAGLAEGIILRDKNSYTLEGKKHTSQKSVLADLTEDEMLLDRVRSQILGRMNEKRLRHA